VFKTSSIFFEDGWVVMEPLVNVVILHSDDAANEVFASIGGHRYRRSGKEDATVVAVVGWEAGGEYVRDFKAGHIQSGSAIPFVGIHKCHCPFEGVRTDVFELVVEGFQAS
jgi:hypothetical protein